MSFGHLILIFLEIFFEMTFLSKNAFSTANCLKLIFFWSSLKNKEIKRLPFSEIHFFPTLPLPLVCCSEVTSIGQELFFFISFKAMSFVLFTFLYFFNLIFINL